jgi:CO/xanthine dehydrogenase Mo-binding subunit
VAGNAVYEAAKDVRRKTLRQAAAALGVGEDAIELAGGIARVRAEPARSVALGELAQRANPMRGAVPPGSEPGLEATNYFGPQCGATAAGAHAMILAIDRETMQIEIRKYVVVHDCGTVLNPLILEGQVQGGVAQGIGGAYFEQLAFDDQGQLTNASFMDYLLPTALDVPNVECGHETTRSPLNALGTKGAGEAGAIPVGALFAQAVEDAFGIPGLEIREMPLSPQRLWELARAAEEAEP